MFSLPDSLSRSFELVVGMDYSQHFVDAANVSPFTFPSPALPLGAVTLLSPSLRLLPAGDEGKGVHALHRAGGG